LGLFERQDPMFRADERRRLRDMVVYIAGAGGLGTHQAQELQRLGARKLYLTDRDVIEESNLNRQVLYGYSDLGRSKTVQAQRALQRFQLPTAIEGLEDTVTTDTVLPSDVDVVLDALDNAPARLALEGAARRAGVPLVHGAVGGWYGQITSIVPDARFSLRSLLQPGLCESESSAVLSPVVAIIASLQVVEAVKLFLGRDDTCVGRLLVVDLEACSMDSVQL